MTPYEWNDTETITLLKDYLVLKQGIPIKGKLAS